VDENGVPIAIIEKRKLDAAKAKENKMKIKASLENRPTLIDRHNQVSLSIYPCIVSWSYMSLINKNYLNLYVIYTLY
jgi:hypothetical protein